MFQRIFGVLLVAFNLTLPVFSAMNWHKATGGSTVLGVVFLSLHIGLAIFMARFVVKVNQRELKWELREMDSDWLTVNNRFFKL